MDKGNDPSKLRIYRAGESREDAKSPAAKDPDSSTGWTAEEEEFDRIIGQKLRSAPVPADLKSRLLGIERTTSGYSYSRWTRKITLVAAGIVVLAVFFGSWRGPFQPAVSMADYRDEMVSFIRIDPFLDIDTPELSRITEFLKNADAPSRLELPQKLQQMQHPLGCRTFRFRGQNVALVCFGREQGDLVHLFVVNRAALSHLRDSDKTLRYEAVGKWMTATWIEGDQAYLLTVEGDRPKLQKYLTDS